MKLSRDAIQRMVEAGGGSGGGGGLSQSQIDAMLSAYAQRSWVDKNYLSIEFFSKMFRLHSTEAGGDDDLIEPNGELPEDTSHLNIEAMFGFWTDLYVSALGKSPTGQPASLFLSSMGDVSIPSPANGQVLTYDSTSGKWVALTPSSGVDMSQVWAAMAAVDATKKIDNSHLKLDTFFTALTNSGNQISMTIGGVTKTLTVAYATAAGDAATLGGTAKGDLFTALSSNWTTNLSATIGGTTRNIPSLYADYANQLRYTREIWGQDFNGTADVTGDLYLDGSNLRLLDSGSSVDCYIVGYRTGNSSKIGVAVEGRSLFEFNDEEFYSSVGIYSAQYVTALSDIRYKEVVNRFHLDVETIASASIIHFRWKEGNDRELHVGGIAQEWQKILPEAVHETSDGKLSLDYGLVGMVSAVSLANKVAEQQQRIDDLESRLKKLESMINRLR